MSTAISTNVKTIDYPALSPTSRQSRIIQANLEGEPMREQDLIRVPTPAGGGTVWSIDNQGNVETTEEIVGILVAEGRRGTLWPKDDPSDMRPVIVTHDLIIGYRVSEDLGDCDPNMTGRLSPLAPSSAGAAAKVAAGRGRSRRAACSPSCERVKRGRSS